MATTTLAASPAIAVSPTAALTLGNVLYEKKDAIAYVTVNRPKVLNALNTPTWKDLRTAFEDARDDATVRGVILTGAGNKAFIAGADISELAQDHRVRSRAVQPVRAGGARSHRESRQAGDRGHQRLCARRRLRDGDGVHHQDRGGQREIRPARSDTRTRSRRWRNATAAAAGRQGPRPAADPVRRDDQRAGGLSHRARQRDRSGRQISSPAPKQS